jgi:hypothetical protein
MLERDTIYDLLVFGADAEQGLEPFRIGDLAMYPNYDVRQALAAFEPNTVAMVVQCGAVFAKCKRGFDTQVECCSSIKMEDEALTPFRLARGGWISAIRVGPEMGAEVEGLHKRITKPEEQKLPSLNKLTIAKDDLAVAAAIRKKMANVPAGYLELALKRFTRSYDCWVDNRLDDCMMELWDALESIASRAGESSLQTLCLRTALLLGNSLYERNRIQEAVKRFHQARGWISRMGRGTGEDAVEAFVITVEFQSLVRAAINASVNILGIPKSERVMALPETMEMAIDNHLFATLHR